VTASGWIATCAIAGVVLWLAWNEVREYRRNRRILRR
jgi:hypothetical protein